MVLTVWYGAGVARSRGEAYFWRFALWFEREAFVLFREFSLVGEAFSSYRYQATCKLALPMGKEQQKRTPKFSKYFLKTMLLPETFTSSQIYA